MNKTQITPEGFQKLTAELKGLKNIKRPQAVERLRQARSMGDLSENSEYVAAKEDLAFIDGRIIEVEMILQSSEIVHNGSKKLEKVELGETVTVEANGIKSQFTIVGEFENDPTSGKLSSSSPIGKALLGRKVGDQIEIDVPAGKITYKIIEIK